MIWDKYNNTITEYQKIINFWDNTINQSTKFRTKNCVEINDDLHGTYNTGSKIIFKTSMLKSRLCDYSENQDYVTIYIYISYSGEKTTPLSKKYFDMISSTVLLQLNFYLQKFIFYNAKINYSNH